MFYFDGFPLSLTRVLYQGTKEEPKEVTIKHKDIQTKHSESPHSSEYETESYVEDPTDEDVENTILDSENDEVCFAYRNNVLSHPEHEYSHSEVSQHGSQFKQQF